MTEPTQKVARYTPDLAEAICERMEEGESLRSICRDPAMPSYQAVLKWRSNVEGFDERYTLPGRHRLTLSSTN